MNITDLLLVFTILLFLSALGLQYKVSKKKDLRLKLKNCEDRFEALFNLAPILIDAFDEKGRCTFWNKECEKVFGWSIDEINASQNALALFYPDEEVQKQVIESFTNADKSVYREWHPLTKDGNKIITLWANVNLPHGETINIGLDITKKRESEKELLQMHDRLKELNTTLEKRVEDNIQEIQKKEQILLQQSRLAQMGEMISMIAHQWRQPLSVIDMTAFDIQNKIDLEKFDLNDKESQKEFLKFVNESLSEIENYTQYLTRTIEDFKNFFKPDKEKELTSLDIPIQKALNIVDSLLKLENIQVEVTNNTKKSINIYTYEMMQVVLNIVKNSIDNFIEKDTQNRKISINVEEKSNEFTIRICDNGGGIEENLIEKIFDPYFSTKDDKNGTGLGLYISKVVIENHSAGELKVKNTDDGVCFTILIFGEL